MVNPVTVTRHDEVAVVTLNNPPVNALSHSVRVALLAALKQLFEAPDVEAIVIACEGRTFVAGADIREFGKAPLLPDLPDVVEFLDGAPQPTIAAIHGTALGGGLELALACHFRVATESAKLGLPEVTLGILPGAGGTQRLPRLIGARAALDMIVSGTPISAPRAERLGLVDEVVGDQVVTSALGFARRVLGERRAPRRVSALSATLEEPNLFVEYERDIAQRFRGFRAPFRCIEAVRAAVTLPFTEGLERERALFRELMASDESKAQRHLFFGEREVAKVPDMPEGTPARPLKSVAIAGAGPLATGLSRCFADARIPVVLLAETRDELERATSEIRQGYRSAVERGRITPAECDARVERIRPTLSYEDARSADLLLEAVPEDLAAKRAELVRLDGVAKPGAVLASSTAFLSLEVLASATSRAESFVGMHFASPIDEATLLECVRTRSSAPDAFATVIKLGRALGKVAVPGRVHVASRLLAQRAREALFLLEEGASPEEVDHALTEFGFARGPFALLDAVGLDAALCERKARLAGLAPRERACTILDELVALGRFGKSSGAGFYRYDGALPMPDATVSALLVRHAKSRGVEPRRISPEEITERCVFSMVNEAARLLDEGVAARALDIDVICVHGAGFPVYRGGPLFFADLLGLRHVRERLLRYREQLGEPYWSLAPRIERLAADGGRFHGEG